MKPFISIFAAAVLAGLGVYFLFEWLNAFGLLGSNIVMSIGAFVCLVTGMTTASAALATLFNRAIAAADDRMVAKLEGRIRALERVLEQGSAAAGLPDPSPPAGEPVSAPPPPPSA